MTLMKKAFAFILSMGLALVFAGCADQESAAKGDRLSGRAGVAITSNNLSRVVPTRDVAPPPN